MARDKDVFVMGEEVGEYQGAYKVRRVCLCVCVCLPHVHGNVLNAWLVTHCMEQHSVCITDHKGFAAKVWA